jgi:hypothetical protein
MRVLMLLLAGTIACSQPRPAEEPPADPAPATVSQPQAAPPPPPPQNGVVAEPADPNEPEEEASGESPTNALQLDE